MKREMNLLFSLCTLFGLLVGLISCEKDDTGNIVENMTVKDIDGNIYPIVKIGEQVWMAENLRTITYNDGTPIIKLEDSEAWGKDMEGAYCWYDNNESAYKRKYGALYNWYAVNSGKIAPEGWHVPTEMELEELERFLGMTNEQIDELGLRGQEQGDKLKSNTGWYQESNGEDDFGFAFLPGGYRNNSNNFTREGQYGYFWSSTELSATNAWYRGLYYHVSKIGRYNTVNKKYGLSIRCIKDN